MMKTLGKLLVGVEPLEIHADLEVAVGGIAYDSRQVRAGDLFVAVQGTRQDGNVYVRDAMQRGAHAIVTELTPENNLVDNYVRVADSRKALAQLAANFFEHPSRNFSLIGVTGTNGKTTTTLILEHILKHEGHSVGVLGTLAYRWADKQQNAPMTTPESLDLHRLFHEMHRDRVTHVVMEVSSHALALGRVEGCAFRAGIFTNLSQDHLDFHSTMEDYFQAKSLLFRNHLGFAQAPPAAVINLDDPYGERLAAATREEVWSYSLTREDARVRVKRADLHGRGIQAEFSTPLGNLKIRSPLVGRLNLHNLLAAATAALALGVSAEAIVQGLAALAYVDGRLQRVPVAPELGYEVVVDYAHTPDAMDKSLSCLREMTAGRLWVVFGCGGDRDRGKRPVMGEVAARWGDMVILTSDNPRSEVPERIIQDIEPGVQGAGLRCLGKRGPEPGERGYMVEPDRKRAIGLALSQAAPGDFIFIGGKGHETYQIIGGRVFPFDDREVVQQYFRSRAVSANSEGERK